LLAAERPLEAAVSDHIRRMSVLWLAIDDVAGPQSDRGKIERNAIALLSNVNRQPIDPPSADWLGLHCDRERVRRSGLWNNNHVDEEYEPKFLDLMEWYVKKMSSGSKPSGANWLAGNAVVTGSVTACRGFSQTYRPG
jgi:hypothetical protein